MSEQQEQPATSRSAMEKVRPRLEALARERSIVPLKDLFWSDLGYERVNDTLSRNGWRPDTAGYLAEDPLLLASGGEDEAFPIIYARLNADRLLTGQERPVVMELLKKHLNGLFIFSNHAQDTWHFVNVKDDTKKGKRPLFRRITIGPDERLRTATERIALLDLTDKPQAARLEVLEQHERAFDVGIVTRKFFGEYKWMFKILQADLKAQGGDEVWAHDYALQFLNRCMFLYFIQRKGWLGDDKEFLMTFWEAYLKSQHESDTFFKAWLQVLFFGAFNNMYHGGHTQFPPHIDTILAQAPYLNGGLFARNELDSTTHAFNISDFRFNQTCEFFQRYNFTIAEDSPLDQEVAVDPEMIGRVYESLVNVSTELDEQGDAGIFYTPRTELDLMCRLALVDYLSNHIGQEKRNILYDVVFALEPHEQAEADDGARVKGIWENIGDCLQHPRILDPACGSGAFLVGMLYVLENLNARVHHERYLAENPYKRKKRIIEECLYGVDVMAWAVQVAELRLWLSLITDAEMSREELHVRENPLLPHLSFKIRHGDSLVQEVGGVNMGHKQMLNELPTPLKLRVRDLKDDKRTYFHNYASRHPKTRESIEQAEFRLFCDIFDERMRVKEEEIKKHQKVIAVQESQRELFEGEAVRSKESRESESVIREQRKLIADKEQDLQAYKAARAKLKTPQDVPFVWDIAFVEVCGSDNKGFDIVIGNPPYVRQEKIAAPRIAVEQDNRTYKAKLAQSVYSAFPDFFGYTESGKMTRKMDAKSDLYVYFYLHGLSLLNEKGSFCFITSNSWLDVGYGAGLQEFLLNYCRVKLILDNSVKRSFASADVNTIITLFSAPAAKPGTEEMNNIVRFAMFKVDFEQILEANVFKAIERTEERTVTNRYRVYPIRQQELLEDGYKQPIAEKYKEAAPPSSRKSIAGPLVKESQAVYDSNKWGGKYLRAPTIYWTIIDKGYDKLVRLDHIADLRYGMKTGANEFFYLNEAKARQWKIENEFLRPIITKASECKTTLIDANTLKNRLFVCHKSKEELKGTQALAYIEWGETQPFRNNPSVAAKKKWWDSGTQNSFDFIALQFRDKRNWSPINVTPSLLASNIVFVGTWHDRANVAISNALLNSTISVLISEVYGRVNLGEGLLTTYGPEILMFDFVKPTVFSATERQSLITAFNELGKRDVMPFFDEIHQSDRRLLDSIVFDALGLTESERNDVYIAIKELMDSRLDKAKSLKETQERNKRVAAVERTLGIWTGLPEEEDEREEEVKNYNGSLPLFKTPTN